MSDSDPDQRGLLDTAQWRSEEFNRSLLRAIQEASPEGILVVDEHGVVVSYNRRFLDIWQIPSKHIQPGDGKDLLVRDYPILRAAAQQVKDPGGFLRRVEELYANPQARDQCEIGLKDGRTLERDSVGLFNDESHYLGRVWFFRDITDRKREEAALQDLAWHDPLTGVMNRSYFFARAAEELTRARRYQRPLAMLMLDLDHFKYINDQYGHAVGDEVLKIVCGRWGEALRSVDLFARIGGEEFAILMPDSSQQAALVVAERLRASVSDQAILADGKEIRCTVSGGIAMVRAEDSSVRESLRRADDALYRAKEHGRNRVESDP